MFTHAGRATVGGNNTANDTAAKPTPNSNSRSPLSMTLLLWCTLTTGHDETATTATIMRMLPTHHLTTPVADHSDCLNTHAAWSDPYDLFR